MEQMQQMQLKPSSPPRSKLARLKLADLPESKTRASGKLVRSVKDLGVRSAVQVADNGDAGYIVLDGARRIDAARRAGLDEIEAHVYDWDDVQGYSALMAVALNEIRKRNPNSNFAAVCELKERGASELFIARNTGLTVPTVNRILDVKRFVKPEFITKMEEGKVKFSVLKLIAQLPQAKQEELLSKDKITAADVRVVKLKENPTRTASMFWLDEALESLRRLRLSAPSHLSDIAMQIDSIFDRIEFEATKAKKGI